VEEEGERTRGAGMMKSRRRFTSKKKGGGDQQGLGNDV